MNHTNLNDPKEPPDDGQHSGRDDDNRSAFGDRLKARTEQSDSDAPNRVQRDSDDEPDDGDEKNNRLRNFKKE